MPDKSIKTESGELVRLTADVGRSSLKQYGGYISEEFDPDLRGIRGARVYDEMRRNEPTVAIGLRAIKWMIGRVLWSAEPGGTTPADEEATKFLQSCMEDCAHTFGKFVRDALTMLEFGYSWNEVTYKVRGGETGDPPSRYDDGRIGWHKMTLVGQDSLLQWDIAFDGTIRAFVQQPYYYGDISDAVGQGLNLGPVTIPMEKSVLFRLDDEKNNPEGISLLRSAYLPWYKKKQIEEIEAIGIERDLTGVLIIHLPVGATLADKEKALDLLEQFKADDMTGFTAPSFGPGEHERWRFEIINSPGSKTIDTDKVIQRYQLELARNFLAQFLMLGQGPTGSRALSEDHSALFQVALLTIVENLADTMNRFLVPPLFRFNDFGQLTSLPTIKAGRLSKEQMERFATALSALATAGLLTPDADLEGYIREQLDLPERSEEVGQDVPDEDTGAQADAAQKNAGKGKKAPPEPEEPEADKNKSASEPYALHGGAHSGHKGQHAGPAKSKTGKPESAGSGPRSSGGHPEEEAIRHGDGEQGVILSATGEVVAKIDAGGDRSLHLSSAQIAQMKGTTFTHNHPRSTSFSDADLITASRAGVAQMRVVSPRYTYTLSANSPKDWKRAQASYVTTNSRLTQRALADVRAGKRTLEDVNANHHHEVMAEVARKTGLSYSRTEV